MHIFVRFCCFCALILARAANFFSGDAMNIENLLLNYLLNAYISEYKGTIESLSKMIYWVTGESPIKKVMWDTATKVGLDTERVKMANRKLYRKRRSLSGKYLPLIWTERVCVTSRHYWKAKSVWRNRARKNGLYPASTAFCEMKNIQETLFCKKLIRQIPYPRNGAGMGVNFQNIL